MVERLLLFVLRAPKLAGFKRFLLAHRKPFIVMFHCLLVVVSYALAFYLRFDFRLNTDYSRVFYQTLIVLVTSKLIVFYFLGIFSGMWRYVSMSDIWLIVKANALATVVFVLAVVFSTSIRLFPRSVFVLDFLLCLSLMTGVRLLTRMLRERLARSGTVTSPIRKSALIIGAGDAGILMLKETRHNRRMGIDVIGFVDDDPLKSGQVIYGVKVLGRKEDIPFLVQRYAVDQAILAIPSLKSEAMSDILRLCETAKVKMRIVPAFNKLLNGDLVLRPRSVRPEDLLGRQVVTIDAVDIEAYIKGKRVLVTGAAGSIGSELTRQIARYAPSLVVLLDFNENDLYFLQIELKTKFPHLKFETYIGDIKDVSLLKHVFSKHQPQVVFHAAAHKHVPLMEENPIAAVRNNVIGTRNLIYAASHYRAERFVLISTDKAVNPTSVMGATKRIAEMLLQAKVKVSRTKFMAVRFGNVIGSTGSVVPLFKKQIEEGGPLTITHPDVKRYFMSISEAVALVLQAAGMGKGGEIFILDMGEQVNILELAKNLVVLSGLRLNEDIEIKFTGLRKGEKLYEEVLLNTEKDTVTKHSKIFVAQAEDFDITALRSQIKTIERFCLEMNKKKVIKMIMEMVPRYVAHE